MVIAVEQGSLTAPTLGPMEEFVTENAPALIAAGSAIAGGAIGAMGVVGAQWLARRAGRERLRHEQAALEQAVYADLIGAVGLLIDVWYRVARFADRARAWDVMLFDPKELQADAREARIAEHRARAVVRIVGDEVVTDEADELGRTLLECSQGLLSRDTPTEERQALLDRAREARDRFVSVASARLDDLRGF